VEVECEDGAGGVCAGGNSSQVCHVMLCRPGGSGFEFPLYGQLVLSVPVSRFCGICMCNARISSVENVLAFFCLRTRRTCQVFLYLAFTKLWYYSTIYLYFILSRRFVFFKHLCDVPTLMVLVNVY